MLLVITLLVLIIGIVMFIAFNEDWMPNSWSDKVSLVCGVTFMTIGAIALFFSLVAFGINYLGLNGQIAEYKAHYESLVFQVEHNLYMDDVTEESNRDLVKEIQKWNCELASKKENQHDFWIGIYIPDIYDQFEFISLEKLAEPHWWEENGK